jgi:mono/diheme cytochrome c family protein
VGTEFPNAGDEIAVVTDGRNGMPSFDGRLTTEEIEQVVEYTRTGLGT